jgi:hypothetical protein
MYALKWNDSYSVGRGWVSSIAEADKFRTVNNLVQYVAKNAWDWGLITVVKVEEQSQTTITLIDAGEV